MRRRQEVLRKAAPMAGRRTDPRETTRSPRTARPHVCWMVDEESSEETRQPWAKLITTVDRKMHDETECDEGVYGASARPSARKGENFVMTRNIRSMRSWKMRAAPSQLRHLLRAVRAPGLLRRREESRTPGVLLLGGPAGHVSDCRFSTSGAPRDFSTRVPVSYVNEVLCWGPTGDHHEVDADERGEIRPPIRR